MEIRAFKLPPLPGKKNSPVQVVNRPTRLLQMEGIKRPYSREKRTQQSSNGDNQIFSARRPSSVRQLSLESARSRQSNDSRNSSQEKNIGIVNYNVKARMSMPAVSSKSWAVYEMKQDRLLYGKRVTRKKEIASLTKMMNLITALEIVNGLSLNPN